MIYVPCMSHLHRDGELKRRRPKDTLLFAQQKYASQYVLPDSKGDSPVSSVRNGGIEDSVTTLRSPSLGDEGTT